MWFWLLLGALLIGAVAYTVDYIITKLNILDTIKNALNYLGTEAAKEAIKSEFEAMIKEKKDNVIKLDVLVQNAEQNSERIDVTINCEGVDSEIFEGMMIKNVI